MLTSSIAGYYEEQEKGSQFNFPTRCSIFAHNICSVRWEEHERGGGGGETPYSPIWLGGLSRSTPVMRILELERESFLVRLEMVLSREDTWRPARERLSQYHRCIQFFSWILGRIVNTNNFLVKPLPSGLFQTISILQFIFHIFFLEPISNINTVPVTLSCFHL